MELRIDRSGRDTERKREYHTVHMKGTRGLFLEICQGSQGYMPGDAVSALLHVDPSAVAENSYLLDQVLVHFEGIERVDTSWVSKEYRGRDERLTSDSRRIQRSVVKGDLRAAARGGFGESARRVFLLRFLLPEWLPPTFRGIVARYSYMISIEVSYRCSSKGEDVRASPLQSAHVRQAVHVWPSLSHTVYDPGENSDDSLKIMCWEVDVGTNIEDAVQQVDSLMSESQNGTPYSPAYQGDRLSRTASLDTGGDLPPAELLKKRLIMTPQANIGRLVSVIPESEISEILDSGPKSPMESTSSRIFDGQGGVSSFRLKMEDIPLANIHLHGSGHVDCALAPGKSVAGTIEFPEHPLLVQCLKFVVALEMEERVVDKWQARGRSMAINGCFNQTIDECVQLSADMSTSYFMFSLPADAAPNFKTSLITLEWGLRFHFYARLKGDNEIKRLEWKIPLKVRLHGDQ